MKKSERIKSIAKYIPPAKFIADVGCDHGYLIVEAFNKYNINKAQAIDNKEGPLNSAKANIMKTDHFENVEFSLSSGIDNLNPNVDCVIMAGMGGILIIDLIKSNLDKILNQKLILQANKNLYELRKFLMNNSFIIIAEEVIKDSSKYYEIIVTQKSISPIIYTERELYFGPINLSTKSKLFIEKLKSELEIIEKIEYKSAELITKQKMIKEVMHDN